MKKTYTPIKGKLASTSEDESSRKNKNHFSSISSITHQHNIPRPKGEKTRPPREIYNDV